MCTYVLQNKKQKKKKSEKVKQLWKHNPHQSCVVHRIHQLLSNCASSLKSWGANKDRGHLAWIKELLEQLKSLQDREDPSSVREEKQVQNELNVLLEKEDLR